MRPMPFAIMELFYKESMEEPLTLAEQLRLMEWREPTHEAPPVFIDLADMEMMELYFLLDHFEKATPRNWKAIKKKLRSANMAEHTDTPHEHRAMVLKIFAIAAAVVVVAAFIWSLAQQDNKRAGNHSETEISSRSVIPPGIDHILLTLPNGKALPLPKNAVMWLKDGTLTVAKTNKPGLIIMGSQVSVGHPAALSSENLPDSFNKSEVVKQILLPAGGDMPTFIATSKRCVYKLALPDGSIAWLNSTSSLKLPLRFDGKQRLVELQGEAYFEVAKDSSRPFIVAAGNSRVEVLGTHFNVTAYPGEAFVRTALLEGKVKLSQGQEEKILLPGQEALAVNNEIKIKQADVTSRSAWINGSFYFDDNSLEEVMSRIARWYDVQVDFRDRPVLSAFAGKIPMSTPLPRLLKILEGMNEVHFEINGKKIIVMKYQGS